MRISLYFGSFNPVHIGHLIISSFVANNTDSEQVWLVVSPQNPLKKASSLLNEFHRLELVRLAIEDDPQLKWSDIEFRLPRPSYTINTLTFLQEKHPQHTFSLLMGSDSFQNISNWKNGHILLNNYQFLIYCRRGFHVHNPPPNIQILKAPMIEIASSGIRDAIKRGKSIRYLVPERVREEIEKGGYYRH